MDNTYLWLGIGAFIVIIIGILSSKRLKAMLSKDGFVIETDKSDGLEKDTTSVKKIKSKSDIYVESPDNRNIDVEDVESSKVRIKK